MHTINIQTIVIIAVFAVGYLFFLIRKIASQQLDLYDLVMLSSVAIVPFIFIAFPRIAEWVAKISGVAFPFVVMFGLLFAIIFLFIYRLTIKLHRLELDNRLLIQEISLLKHSTTQSSPDNVGNT